MQDGTLKKAFIGRQPIYDRDLQVYGYELLYRRSEVNSADIVDGEQATAQVIVNTFLEFGLDRLVGTCPAFINVSPQLLLESEALPFPKDQVGIELPEDILLDAQLIAAVQAASSEGYRIALDNFRYHERLLPLVKLADIVKIDVHVTDDITMSEYVRQLRPHKVKLVANRVETHEELASCMAIGFDYFQGYFLAKPKLIKQHGIAPSRLAVLRLLAALQDPDAGVKDIEKLVSQDLSLSYKLLRYINSATFALRRQVESIQRAVTYLGLEPMKQWVRLVAMSSVEDQPRELVITALNRAKMCEVLGKTAGHTDTDRFFTVGLFSALDALMEIPLEAVLEQLPLADELTGALLRYEGELGQALMCTLAHEQGNWSDVAFAQMPAQAINEAFVQAAEWSRETGNELLAG